MKRKHDHRKIVRNIKQIRAALRILKQHSKLIEVYPSEHPSDVALRETCASGIRNDLGWIRLNLRYIERIIEKQ